jgi:hypothetical protein
MTREKWYLQKIFFYAGIVFLLIGLAFLIVSSQLRNIKQVPVERAFDSWEISVDLKGEVTYVLDIVSSNKWRDDYTDGLYETPQPIDAVITSPGGGETKLQVFFYARLSSSPYYKSTFPVVVEVEYVSVDSHSLQIDEHYPRVRFTTKQRGNYTARLIEQTLNWTEGPPKEITLYIEVFENQNSYTFFLQSGGILCLSGVAISVYGARATKKLRIRQTKKFKK